MLHVFGSGAMGSTRRFDRCDRGSNPRGRANAISAISERGIAVVPPAWDRMYASSNLAAQTNHHKFRISGVSLPLITRALSTRRVLVIPSSATRSCARLGVAACTDTGEAVSGNQESVR